MCIQISACHPFLVRRPVWNVQVWAGMSACVSLQNNPSVRHWRMQQPVWVGLHTPTKGREDYSSRAWWPGESLWISGSNQVNHPCLHSGRMTIPHPNSYFTYYSPTCPTCSLSSIAAIHSYQVCCSFPSCLTDTIVELIPPCSNFLRSLSI